MDLIVTIDTEEEWDWEAGFPVKGFDTTNILELHRFADLCEQYGVATTYFVNHAVLQQDSSAEVIRQISRRPQVEIGMHCHPWTTPPKTPDDQLARMSFLENHPPDIALQKLENTYQLHRERGFQPTSFRGGRYSSAEVTRQFLLNHDFLVDASICPFTGWPDEGAPDYRRMHEQPSRVPDSHGLWQMPLTRIFSRRPFAFWNRWLSKIETTPPLARLRLIGIMQSLGIIRRIWLNFETEEAAAMVWVVENATRLRLPYLCFTVHSSSLALGPNPYSNTPEKLDRIYQGIERVFQTLARIPEMRPLTISQLARELESNS